MDSILTKKGLNAYHVEMLKYIETQSSVLEYPSSLQFPTIGKEGKIYVDIKNNQSYRWDDENLKYYCIGGNYNDIETINGGGAA